MNHTLAAELTLGMLLTCGLSLACAAGSKTDIRDVVGSCHINGFYNFTDKDFLNEGADTLLALGARVIKLACRDHLEAYYPLNSAWPELRSLVEVVQTPYYQHVLAKPFSTYVLMTYTPGRDIHYFLKGMTCEDVKREQDSFYEFTKYLLTAFRGTGKTFVLQNWEGDWVLTPPYTDKQVDPAEAQGMIDWLNARQDGVDRARREVKMDGVRVFHAAEVNLVDRAMQGKATVTNSVLPHTHCDLYSYSAYDTILQGPKAIRRALDYLAKMAPDSKLFGARNIYVGEFGVTESSVGDKERLRIVREALETYLDFGVRYALFWELYCDGPKRKLEGRPANSDMAGNWLIRPDGTRSTLWNYFADLFAGRTGSGSGPTAQAGNPISTIGLYTWSDVPDQHAFWKACGYNTLQFLDTGWHRRPDLLPKYYDSLARQVDSAKRAGFRVYVNISSNISQWKGPEELEPTGVGTKFHPENEEAMRERLSDISNAVRLLKNADGFTFFAGDPGGVPTELGTSDARACISMARQVKEIVGRHAPHAQFNFNPWAIAAWQYWNISPMLSAFWLRQLDLEKEVLGESNLIGPNCGLELAPSNYYRSLTLKAMVSEGITPELFPTASDIGKLRARGTKRIWAWPYFLSDEADDGYTGSIWGQGDLPQPTVRYLHKLVAEMREIGVDGVIGNWSWRGHLANALNTYALARFCADSSATPLEVVSEYAAHVASDDSKDTLAQILAFIENNGTWQQSLPKQYQLGDLDCGDLTSGYLAIVRLKTVSPRAEPDFPLPEPPAAYLERITKRLESIAAAQRTPEVSHDVEGGELFGLSGANSADTNAATGGLDGGMSPSADRACVAVCTVPTTGFPARLDIPIELRLDHEPAALRLGYVAGNSRAARGRVYWDDVYVGSVDTYSQAGECAATIDLPIPATLQNASAFRKGTHVCSLVVDSAVLFWDAAYFRVDALLVGP